MTENLPLGSGDYQELAEFLEHQLHELGDAASQETDEIRWRLVHLYLQTLEDRSRAAVHVAELLMRGADIGQEAEAVTPELAVVFEALVDSAHADQALAWLRAYYEKSGDKAALAQVLSRQALRAPNPEEGRALALRAVKLRASDRNAERTAERWLWLVNNFGPDHEAHTKLIPLLQRLERWAELGAVLEADVELASSKDRPRVLAKLGELRLARLADSEGALAALRWCLAVDPTNDAARKSVESLFLFDERRLAAADVLEPIYRETGAHEGLLRVLEAKADLSPDGAVRLRALGQAAEMAEGGHVDSQHAANLCGRALVEALALAPESVPDWLARLERVTALCQVPDLTLGQILSGVLDGRTIRTPEEIDIAVRAVAALRKANAVDEAVRVGQRALEASPSDAGLLQALDELLADNESASAKLARYEAAAARETTVLQRSKWLHAAAALRRDALDDLPGAVTTWRQLLAEDIGYVDAHLALVESIAELGDTKALALAILRAQEAMPDRSALVLTLQKTLEAARHRDSAVARELGRALLDEPLADAAALELVASAADDEDDRDTYRRALELLIERGDAVAKKNALERLGDFQFDKLGDRRAAAQSWKPAAILYEGNPDDQVHAQHLYERVLEALPEDDDARTRLVGLYADLDDWAKMPEVLGGLLRGEGDKERGAELLLTLEASAKKAGAVDEFVALAEEALLAVGQEAPRLAEELKRAKARALASDPARPERACFAYRELIERVGAETDVRSFLSFVESLPSAEDRQRERRWILRVARSA